jgi:hypothetical protein
MKALFRGLFGTLTKSLPCMPRCLLLFSPYNYIDTTIPLHYTVYLQNQTFIIYTLHAVVVVSISAIGPLIAAHMVHGAHDLRASGGDGGVVGESLLVPVDYLLEHGIAAPNRFLHALTQVAIGGQRPERLDKV